MSWKYSILSHVKCLHCGKEFLNDLFYDRHFDKNGRPILQGDIECIEGIKPRFIKGYEIVICPYCEQAMNAIEPYYGYESDPKFRKVFFKSKNKSESKLLNLFLKIIFRRQK